MSKPNEPAKGGFIQRIRFEDKIMEQIGTLLSDLSYGDTKSANNSFESLECMLYGIPKIDLKDYDLQIKIIKDEFQLIYDKKMIEYKEECKGAQVPDVIDIPSKQLPIDSIRGKTKIILKTFAENGITLTSKNLTHM